MSIHSRRNFLKAFSLMTAGALISPKVMAESVVQAASSASSAEKAGLVGWKFSGAHWGAFRAKVVANKITEIKPFEFDQYPSDMIYNIPGLVYNSSRVRYPMVRLDWFKNGYKSDRTQRGDNRFVRVSWDQAIDLMYNEMERIQQTYGPSGLLRGHVGWRSVGQVHSCGNHMHRGIKMHGNSIGTMQDYSTGAGQTIMPYVMGTTEVYIQGTSWEYIVENTELLIFWAMDPIKNLQIGWNTETHESYIYLEQIKEKIAKNEMQVISIDPIVTKTQKHLGTEHQYLHPLTDVAFQLAIAHTLWKEDLYDKEFIETYTVGFELFLPYLKGETEDMVEKTPEWAEPICGVPAERIRELARLMASKRTQIMMGWGIQRNQHGEQPFWMAAIIAAMLGEIGLPGGGISYSHNYSGAGVTSTGASMPSAFPLNLDLGRKPKYDNEDYKGAVSVIPLCRAIDAIDGKEIDFNGSRIKLPAYRMAIFSGSNHWARHQDKNRMKREYLKLETIVSIDYNWTATCRFADIVMPACTPYERNDLDIYGTYCNRGIIAMHKLVDPLYQSRSDFDIWLDFSKRLGREEEYCQGMNEMEWIEKLYNDCLEENRAKGFYMPPFEEFWEKGYVLFPDGEPFVQHAAFREDPEVNALGTPSGFIEIYSRKIASYGYDDCKGHPIWMEKSERSHGGPKSDRYPFWLQSIHPDHRLHSQMCEVDSARAKYEVQGREPIYMNPADAARKGIEEGDLVRVFNDRGQLLAGARLSEDYPEGIVRIHEGGWFAPLDETIGSIDTYGDANTLTPDIGSSKLAQAVSANTCVVDFEKYEGEVPPVTAFGGPIMVDPEGNRVDERS